MNQATTGGVTPLYIACQNGHVDVANFLVQEGGAEVNQAKTDGATPLHVARLNGHLYVMRVLVQIGGKFPRISTNGHGIDSSNGVHFDNLARAVLIDMLQHVQKSIIHTSLPQHLTQSNPVADVITQYSTCTWEEAKLHLSL